MKLKRLPRLWCAMQGLLPLESQQPIPTGWAQSKKLRVGVAQGGPQAGVVSPAQAKAKLP